MGAQNKSKKKVWVSIAIGLALCATAAVAVGVSPNSEAYVFDFIYNTGYWGRAASGEGTSGGGSTEEVTREYRKFIEDLIREENITSVVDAGCGDWAFSQFIDWGGAEYLGVDVSKVVLERTKARFTAPGLRFELGSAIDALPAADMLIVKDVLQHVPNVDVQEFIRNNLQPGRFRIAVITNDRDVKAEDNNRDIFRGDQRGLNLGEAPFNLEGLEDHRLFEAYPDKIVQVLRLR